MSTSPDMPVTSVDADTLDKEQIDQLHAATLQISGNCFELKKLCGTVLVAAGTLVASFANKQLDHAVFIAGLALIVIFWAADSQSYYLQAKLRRRMTELQRCRVLRAQLTDYDLRGVGLPIRLRGAKAKAVLGSFFNASMLFYALLGSLVALSWALFAADLINSTPATP